MSQYYSRTHLVPVVSIGLAACAMTIAVPWLRPLEAAPKTAKPKPAPAAKTVQVDAQGQRVIAALSKFLRGRVTNPNGKLQLKLVPTARVAEGYFSEIYMAGHPAQIKKLHLSELVMRARNVHINVPHLMQTGRLQTFTSNTSLRAVISEGDLTNLLAKGKHSKDMGLKVKYVKHPTWGDVMHVTGKLNWTLINGPVSGYGKLKLMPGHQVHLEILSMQLRGHEVPAFIKNQFMNKVNPVVEYDDLPFRPKIKALKVQGGKATLFA